MHTPLEALEAEVLNLRLEDRGRLLERLIVSLDSDPSIEAAWMAVARRRDEDIESGAVEVVPGHIAMASLRARLESLLLRTRRQPRG